MMDYQWTAWDEGKWDHYHHAGIQVRFYRVCPFRVVSMRRRWWNVIADAILSLLVKP